MARKDGLTQWGCIIVKAPEETADYQITCSSDGTFIYIEDNGKKTNERNGGWLLVGKKTKIDARICF